MWDVQIGATHARAKEGSRDRYHQTLLGADALLMLSRQNFRPFLLLGVGAERDMVDNPLRHVRKTSPYATAGLGFQLGLSEQWAMQADLRTVRGRLRDDSSSGFDRSNNTLSDDSAELRLQTSRQRRRHRRAAGLRRRRSCRQRRLRRRAATATTGDGPLSKKSPCRPPSCSPSTAPPSTLPQPRLDEIAAALLADPTITDVDITGYADRLGSERKIQPQAVAAPCGCGARLSGRPRALMARA